MQSCDVMGSCLQVLETQLREEESLRESMCIKCAAKDQDSGEKDVSCRRGNRESLSIRDVRRML